MSIDQYRIVAAKNKYREVLTYIVVSEPCLHSFLEYNGLDVDLKIHLTKVIITRHFSATGGVALPADVNWFIEGFLSEFESDLVKPWITPAIKESLRMITSEDIFGKVIVGMTYMFGVVEFYAKYRLGYRPENYDLFDEDAHSSFRKMFLNQALNKLKKTQTSLGRDLAEIDKLNVDSLRAAGIVEKRHVKSRIADRLMLARNTMLHGEAHFFYDKAKYLVMIYILFHLHGLKDGFKYEGK